MRHILAVLALCAIAANARADVTVRDAWVRATVPGQDVAGAYMVLSSDAATRLLSAATPAASKGELHQMSMEGNVMKMRAVAGIDVPRGGSIALEPGGYHVMLFGLKKPLHEGDVVPLTLKFRDKAGRAETIEVAATVRAVGETMPHGGKHEH